MLPNTCHPLHRNPAQAIDSFIACLLLFLFMQFCPALSVRDASQTNDATLLQAFLAKVPFFEVAADYLLRQDSLLA